MRTLLVLTLLAACNSRSIATADLPDAGGAPSFTVHRTDLATDRTIPSLVNAWGLGFDGTAMWVAANATDSVQRVGADGAPRGAQVAMPAAPSGLVFTGDDLDLDGDTLIVATESGAIAGWHDALGAAATVRADASGRGAVYKGVAIVNEDPMRLAVTDFHNGAIDVYGPGYAAVNGAGFADPQMAAGFAPFGIAMQAGEVFVSYAEQDAAHARDVTGIGHGFVDVFTFDGRLSRRLISGDRLSSPWALAIAPASWGAMAGLLLVGNSGDGAINLYDRSSGEWRGALVDPSGAPIAIDGLRALSFGPKTDAADLSDRLFFTAGPDDEAHGLFGTLAPL